MSLKDDLHKFFTGEIVDDEKTLELFSTDASIFKIKPKIIAYPQNSEDIENLVNYITKNPTKKLFITPRSAGTCMSGGAIGESIILEMTNYFNRIKKFGEDYVVVQPGVFYRDFEKATLEKDLLLPCFTASRELNTVGGMVGNNSAGEQTLSFGQTERYVKALKVVLADGKEYEIKPLNKAELDKKMAQKDFEGKIYREIYNLIEDNYELIKEAKPKVSKNSSGYLLWKVWDHETFDLTKIFTGSQGTLGVVTEITFHLVKPKHNKVLLAMNLNKIDNLDQIVNQVLEFHPESFECYDDQTLGYAVRFLKEISEKFKLNSKAEVYKSFIPEIIYKWFNALPKLVLLANFASTDKNAALKQAGETQKSLAKFNLKSKIIDNDKEAEKYWVIRHESFSLLRHHALHMRSAPFIDDIIVKPEKLPEFLPKLNTLISKYQNKMIYTVAGHIGDGNFHIIPLMDFTKEDVRAIVPELSKEVFDLVFEYGGSMSAEHNDGLMRGPYLEKMFGENIYQLFKEVKQIFDPNNIFNPHKKIDATFEYSLAHMSKS